MQLKGKKFVVTGGAGFIGSHVVDQLLKVDVGQVVVLDNLIRGNLENLKNALSDKRVKFYKVDIAKSPYIERYFEDVAGCFHMAALRITHCASNPKLALDVMGNGTYRVLKACIKQKVEKVVFSSTASVYGMADCFPTDEKHHPWNNKTWYGVLKVLGEGMLQSFRDMFGLNYVALRYFNVYGPRMDVHGRYTEVLIRWLEQFQRGERPKIFGNGKQTMDFIYVEDVSRANLLAMRANIENAVLNVASGQETSLKELCELLRKVVGSELEPEFVVLPDDRKKVEVLRRLADTRMAERKIGFRSRVGLEDGLRKLVRWVGAQQEVVASL